MATRLQILARKRNWWNYKLKGMHLSIDYSCLTEDEIEKIENIKKLRNELISSFDTNSRLKGLNVPIKCWCGKPVSHVNLMFCTKHI